MQTKVVAVAIADMRSAIGTVTLVPISARIMAIR